MISAANGKVWRAAATARQLEELPKGMDALYFRCRSFFKRAIPRKQLILRRAEKIMAIDHSSCSEAELKLMLENMRQTFVLGRESDADLDEAFALIREAAFRSLGMKPYKVQIAGALAIEKGFIAEMATGEGKTLTATLPAVIAGWRGRGCHVLTTNNYLACRDAEEMSPIYEFCGLKVAGMAPDAQDDDRTQAYLADITYCTNSDVAADFLRDQLANGSGAGGTRALLSQVSGLHEKELRPTLRGLECAIVDEADSVLIDDGVTPLLISGESNNKEENDAYGQAFEMAKFFVEDESYTVNEKLRDIRLNEEGEKLLQEKSAELAGLWNGVIRREELLIQALIARHFFIRDKQYILEDDKVVIVDESTGRLMPDRFWRAGTHQAVEAKEGVTINPCKETYARISFQKFFRLYKKLSGMSGTAAEARGEFAYFYQRDIVPIPTHRKCLRQQARNHIYRNDQAKLNALVDSLKELHKTGRPILVGTGSILDSEKIANKLEELGYDYDLLNARFHKEEAEIVKEAGQLGRITVATNMAGRGTDIKLSDEAKAAGGLHVFATELFDSPRIDRQLYGRASRQGDPGSAVAYISLEDPLLNENIKWLAKVMSFLYKPLLSKRLPLLAWLFAFAQWLSVRKGRRQRKSVMQSDNWLEGNLGFAGKEH